MMNSINVLEQFEKKFEFKLDGIDRFNDVNKLLCQSSWTLQETLVLEKDLNEIKCLLNDKDLITWGKHTARTDLSSFIVSEARRKIPSSEFFTRAWLKFTEIVFSFPLIPLVGADPRREDFDCGDEVNALYLCEAPGAFINASNYHLKNRSPKIKFNWTATSLNPYYEELDGIGIAITDDRFIRQKKTHENWFFGDDNNRGDILDTHFVKQICCKFKETKANFVTGDGGINCVDNPSEQEQLVFPLIFHQFLVAINCLKPGGSCLIKFFTLFSSQTLCLVYLMSSFFERVAVFKPITSKAGNSEVYIIGCHLLQDSRGLISKLTEKYFQAKENCDSILSKTALLGRDVIPSRFIEQFIQCSSLFEKWQKSAILGNLEIFNSPDKEEVYHSLIGIKKSIERIFFRKYEILPIDPSLHLCHGCDLGYQKHSLIQIDPEILVDFVRSRGTYRERMASSANKLDQLPLILDNLYDPEDAQQVFTEWWKIEPASVMNIKFNRGHSFTTITNSPFVDIHLLHLFNLITNHRNNKMFVKEFKDLPIFRFWERLQSVFKPILSAPNGEKFSSIIGPKSSFLLDGIFNAIQMLYSCTSMSLIFTDVMDEKLGELSKARKIVLIDWTHGLVNKMIQQELKKDSCLSLVFDEKESIKGTLGDLRKILPSLKPNDVVIIHLETALSRLSAGLLFLMTTLYSQLAILPSFTYPVQGTASEIALQLGQLYLFTNQCTSDAHFDVHLRSKIMETFDEIQRHLEINSSGDNIQPTSLLEIFPTTEILSNDLFRQLVYTGNFVHLVEKMQTMMQ